MAFAGRDKILYGRGFDAVKIPADSKVDLDDLGSVEANLSDLVLYEIKSTRRENLSDDFKGYFFALSTAELLVAQSLGEQYRFLLIHTLTGARVELTLQALQTGAQHLSELEHPLLKPQRQRRGRPDIESAKRPE